MSRRRLEIRLSVAGYPEVVIRGGDPAAVGDAALYLIRALRPELFPADGPV